jgi:hypothetical protein
MKYYAYTGPEITLTELFIDKEVKTLMELGLLEREKRSLSSSTHYYLQDGVWAGYSVSQSMQLSPRFMERYFPHLL